MIGDAVTLLSFGRGVTLYSEEASRVNKTGWRHTFNTNKTNERSVRKLWKWEYVITYYLPRGRGEHFIEVQNPTTLE